MEFLSSDCGFQNISRTINVFEAINVCITVCWNTWQEKEDTKPKPNKAKLIHQIIRQGFHGKFMYNERIISNLELGFRKVLKTKAK